MRKYLTAAITLRATSPVKDAPKARISWRGVAAAVLVLVCLAAMQVRTKS